MRVGRVLVSSKRLTLSAKKLNEGSRHHWGFGNDARQRFSHPKEVHLINIPIKKTFHENLSKLLNWLSLVSVQPSSSSWKMQDIYNPFAFGQSLTQCQFLFLMAMWDLKLLDELSGKTIRSKKFEILIFLVNLPKECFHVTVRKTPHEICKCGAWGFRDIGKCPLAKSHALIAVSA